MGLAPDIDTLANRAAERLRASKDKSNNAFYNTIDQVIRGAGIGASQHRRYREALQRKLARRSASARSSQAAARKAAQG